MKKKIENALEEATVGTFEDICFMCPAPELKDAQQNLKVEAAAEVKYRGNFTGKLLIETRGEIFAAIAANILSVDCPTAKQKKDALGEIANIICGNIVPYLGTGGHGYKIESPRFLSKDELLKQKSQVKPLAELIFNFSQGRVDIKFFVDDYCAEEKKA
jgi:hypothetical protein